MAELDTPTPDAEKKYHRYSGYEIPWYIHAVWISFWLFAIGYLVVYALPLIRSEIANPP
jgi:hypothetical protein